MKRLIVLAVAVLGLMFAVQPAAAHPFDHCPYNGAVITWGYYNTGSYAWVTQSTCGPDGWGYLDWGPAYSVCVWGRCPF